MRIHQGSIFPDILGNRNNKPNLEIISNIGDDISAQVCGVWRTEKWLDADENWVRLLWGNVVIQLT